MPSRRGYPRRRQSLRPVNSTKNSVYLESSTGTTKTNLTLISAVDSALLAATTDIERSSTVNNVWISLDICGLAATGVLQSTTVYLMKNPGTNLTPPTPRTEGSSNEKKFIFKTWNYMTMRNQDGNPPYHWEGWVKIPKQYRRFGAADLLQMIVATTTSVGHLSVNAIYKWYK